MISCSQYDMIEIVCMHRYPVRLTLHKQLVLEGIALDTQVNKNHEECIKIDLNGVVKLVVLDHISIMEVTIENPHFRQVSFSTAS